MIRHSNDFYTIPVIISSVRHITMLKKKEIFFFNILYTANGINLSDIYIISLIQKY